MLAYERVSIEPEDYLSECAHVYSTYATDVIYVLLLERLYLALGECLKLDLVGFAFVLERDLEVIIEVHILI